jgi:hypothetical protein
MAMFSLLWEITAAEDDQRTITAAEHVEKTITAAAGRASSNPMQAFLGSLSYWPFVVVDDSYADFQARGEAAASHLHSR